MKQVPLCIHHANCADGFTAAWAVNKYFKGAVDFHPATYGDAPPDVAGRDVIVVDFSYKLPVLGEIAESARSVLVLDHHKTAAEELAGLEPPESEGYAPDLWAGEFDVPECPVRAVFDTERSGAQIAWDFFFPGRPRPKLVDYVGDRDLWRFMLPKSREVNSYVSSFDFRFWIWDALEHELNGDTTLRNAAAIGEALDQRHLKAIRDLLPALTRRMAIGGTDVPVANLPFNMASDAGNIMCKGEAFSATYCDTPDGRAFSLRSAKNGHDVSETAKQYSGGGHRHAAGFRVPFADLAPKGLL